MSSSTPTGNQAMYKLALENPPGAGSSTVKIIFEIPEDAMSKPGVSTAIASIASQLAKAMNDQSTSIADLIPPAGLQPAGHPKPGEATHPHGQYAAQGAICPHMFWPPGLQNLNPPPYYNLLSGAKLVIMMTRDWLKVQHMFNHCPKDHSIPGIEYSEVFDATFGSEAAEQYLAYILLWNGDALFYLTGNQAPAIRNVRYFDPKQDKVPFPPMHCNNAQYFGLFCIRTARMPENAMLALVVRCFMNTNMPMYERYAALLSLKYFEKELCNDSSRPHGLRRYYSPAWWAEVLRHGILMMFSHVFYPETHWLNPEAQNIQIRHVTKPLDFSADTFLVGSPIINDKPDQYPVQTITLPSLNLREARKLFWKFFAESYLCCDQHVNPLKVGGLSISRLTALQYYKAHQKNCGDITQAIYDLGLNKVMNDAANENNRIDIALNKALDMPNAYTHLYHYVKQSVAQACGSTQFTVQQCLKEMLDWLTPSVKERVKLISQKLLPGSGHTPADAIQNQCNQLILLQKTINNQPNTSGEHWHQTLPVLWAYCKQRGHTDDESQKQAAHKLKHSLCTALLSWANNMVQQPNQVDQAGLLNAMMQALCNTRDATLLKPIRTLKAFTKHVGEVLQRYASKAHSASQEEPIYNYTYSDFIGRTKPLRIARPVMELMSHYVCGLGNTPDSIFGYLLDVTQPCSSMARNDFNNKTLKYRRQYQRSLNPTSEADYMAEDIATQLKTCKTPDEIPKIPPDGTQFARGGISAAQLLLQNPNLEYNTANMLDTAILNGIVVPMDEFMSQFNGTNLNALLNNLPYRPHPIEAVLRTRFIEQDSIQTEYNKVVD